MSKKQKEDPAEHEKKYIEYLEGQIQWHTEKMKELKYKLSKARLVLEMLKVKK